MADGISLGSLWIRSGHSGHPGANISRSLSVERTDRAEYSIFKVLKYFCDTAHRIEREGAETLVFDKGADSVDFALANRVQPGDIVITQDYGLASMCLARRARVLSQNSLEYTAQNIDGLLARRHENKKLLRAGKHPKGPAKRTKEQNEAFVEVVKSMLGNASLS